MPDVQSTGPACLCTVATTPLARYVHSVGINKTPTLSVGTQPSNVSDFRVDQQRAVSQESAKRR